jgi:predicted DsbA family dithiol-disulfide isomerase
MAKRKPKRKPIKLEIMTSKTCAFCPIALDILRKVAKEFGKDVKLVETNIDTTRGRRRAARLRITVVPTILIENEPKFTGVPRETFLRSAIKLFIREKR